MCHQIYTAYIQEITSVSVPPPTGGLYDSFPEWNQLTHNFDNQYCEWMCLHGSLKTFLRIHQFSDGPEYHQCLNHWVIINWRDQYRRLSGKQWSVTTCLSHARHWIHVVWLIIHVVAWLYVWFKHCIIQNFPAPEWMVTIDHGHCYC